MKILFGTTNQAKLDSVKRIADQLGFEVVGLNDVVGLSGKLPKIIENGKNPLQNAKIKSEAYYEAFEMPVFSCDSGLYFYEIAYELQPGTHIRRVNGKELTDNEMIEYYSKLADRYGGKLMGRYRTAIYLTFGDKIESRGCLNYSSMDESLATEPFMLVNKPHKKIVEGYPLDSLSVDIKSGKYYYDLGDAVDKSAIEVGLKDFFKSVLEDLKGYGI